MLIAFFGAIVLSWIVAILGAYLHERKDAFSAAGDDPTSRTKYLIVEVCKIDDKKITPEQIDEMHIRDALYLSQVVELMMKSL